MAAKMLIGAQLVELRGRPDTPIFTPTDLTDLLLDIWLLLNIEPEFTEEDLACPKEVAEAAKQGFVGMFT
jgi:hypothetical protein